MLAANSVRRLLDFIGLNTDRLADLQVEWIDRRTVRDTGSLLILRSTRATVYTAANRSASSRSRKQFVLLSFAACCHRANYFCSFVDNYFVIDTFCA